MPPSLLFCCSLDCLGWQLLDQAFIFYVFFSFHPSLLRFPHGVYNSCVVSCASSPLFRPPQSYPRSRSRPRSHLRYCSRFRPRSRLCSRPRSHPILCSSTGLHPHPCPRPVPARAPVSILRSFVRLHPRFRSRSRSILITVHFPVPIPDPVTVSVPTPTPFAPSRPSDPVTPSVRCACTDTGP